MDEFIAEQALIAPEPEDVGLDEESEELSEDESAGVFGR
jgi:hypothetical protein